MSNAYGLRFRSHSFALAVCLSPLCAAFAAEPIQLPAVAVTGTRGERPIFDLPMSIDRIDGAQLERLTPAAGVVNALQHLPGLHAGFRETWSQEPQLTVRGFGARSQFGVRGVRLLVDGIPANTPDGQGSTGLIDPESIDRIEVLRGPFSALYGNHSGGVVQVWTREGQGPAQIDAQHASGTHGLARQNLRLSGGDQTLNALASVSRLRTDGYRDWSAARKEQFNAKLVARPSLDSEWTLTANVLHQPLSQDPLGLSAAQMAQNRRQAHPDALIWQTGRRLDNRQAGLKHEVKLSGDSSLSWTAYAGSRSNAQFLAFSGAGALSSGGVSVFDRAFHGLNMAWSGQHAAWRWTVGAEYEGASEERRGYVNDHGLQGALRRNERNRSNQSGVYAQAEFAASDRLAWHAGVRATRVGFTSQDRYITSLNPDDSGRLSSHAVTPALGLLWRLTPSLHGYANVGRSVETPTSIELAYRNVGSGPNFALRPTTSAHAELGVKFRQPGRNASLALFHIGSRDEIVVDANNAGRTTYKNAGRTRRQGVELATRTLISPNLEWSISATLMQARFHDAFTSGSGLVEAGRRVPGVPSRQLATGLNWLDALPGLTLGLEARYVGSIAVTDDNRLFAPSHTLLNFTLNYERIVGPWTLNVFARLDNLAAREYVSAVYVNDSTRPFAPGAGRSGLAGVSAAWRF